jgi:hypothetical protein
MRNLDRIVHCFTVGDGTASQELAEAFPFEEFGDQKRSAVMLADVVEGEDVRMAQSGDGPGFLLEPAEALRIGGDRRREDLDCDIPAQAGVAGSVPIKAEISSGPSFVPGVRVMCSGIIR